jgi:RNase H-fold protein (predicted Holliday junction resolvase)
VLFVDERLSSFAAAQGLNDRRRSGEKLTRRAKKRRLDAIAAADFLQAYLDGRLPAVERAGGA